MAARTWVGICGCAALIMTGCGGSGGDGTQKTGANVRTRVGAPTSVNSYDPAAFNRLLTRIEKRRLALSAQYARARTAAQRAALRQVARRFVVDTIVDEIFPAWMGTPWGMGRNSTSTVPHQPGMTVGCSYFVTSVLLNVGLRLDNRYRFAQAPALHIQRSLAPRRRDLQRYVSIPAGKLEQGIRQRGDGLYVIGLVNHVAFVLVRDGRVTLVHSGYVPNADVIHEPFATAQVIDLSREAGYFVTPVFADDRLVEHWLRGRAVRFQKLGARG